MTTRTTIRPIEQLGAPVLRQMAAPVEDIDDPAVAEVIESMLATLAATEGVGIAAPQIGESLRIVVVASRPTARYPSAPSIEPTVMINPEFEPLSNEFEKGWEGCLSIPGIRALVPRYRRIAVGYRDRRNQRQNVEFDDFVARVFQHEFDHLDGKVYLDRVESNRDIISEQEYQNLIGG
ncbi:MAG: peptide deformylase [Methylomicrobium sp.]